MNIADSDVQATITEIIRARLNVEVSTADTDLLETGVLDSLALVMLIAALEEEFACELLLDDFDLDWFRSVEQIADHLRSSGVIDARVRLVSDR
jgi:acyl carrier protein